MAQKFCKIKLTDVPVTEGSQYPSPYDEACRKRFRQRLGDAAGLTQFGVNKVTLKPGQWSSQRHWHTAEDEFVYILSGEAVLVTNLGEETLLAGDCAGFSAGQDNGHHLQNRTDSDVVYLEVGTRNPDADEAYYPDIDLFVPKGRAGYLRKDGTAYEGKKPRNPAGEGKK